VLKNDKNEVFRASADASKAYDYLHSLEKGRVKSALRIFSIMGILFRLMFKFRA